MGFPPKPEERWRYIKELKVASRACVRQRNRPPARSHELNQPTSEQRQLEQMQADMSAANAT